MPQFQRQFIVIKCISHLVSQGFTNLAIYYSSLSPHAIRDTCVCPVAFLEIWKWKNSVNQALSISLYFLTSQNQAVQMHRNNLLSCWCGFPPWDKIIEHWEKSCQIHCDSLSIVSWIFLRFFFIKINCCLSAYQNNWTEGEIKSLVTFRFAKKTAVVGLYAHRQTVEWCFYIQIYIFLS